MKRIIITIQGGAVVDVTKPDDCEVVIRDYDTDGVDEERLAKDSDGDDMVEFVFPAE